MTPDCAPASPVLSAVLNWLDSRLCSASVPDTSFSPLAAEMVWLVSGTLTTMIAFAPAC